MRIQASARQRVAGSGPRVSVPAHSALALKGARDQADYLRIYHRLIGTWRGVGTESFAIPRKPGPFGTLTAWIKKCLWKLLRYQHDRMAWQQHLINELVIAGLEFEREESRREIARLEERVARLEAQGRS